MDKNTAVWEWIQSFPDVKELYFNFGAANNGASVLIPNPTDNVISTDITGIKTCRYDFAYAVFLAYDSTTPYGTTNISSLNAAENFGRWIAAQDADKSYPDFGTGCIITGVRVLSNSPIATAVTETITKYVIQVRIEYEQYD